MLYQTENQHGGDVYGGGITLDFSANTNPLGTPPGVLEAVCRTLPQLHRYPDPYCRALRAAIAAAVLCIPTGRYRKVGRTRKISERNRRGGDQPLLCRDLRMQR